MDAVFTNDVKDDIQFWTEYFTRLWDYEVEELYCSDAKNYSLNYEYFCLSITFKAIMERISKRERFMTGNLDVMIAIAHLFLTYDGASEDVPQIEAYIRRNAIF